MPSSVEQAIARGMVKANRLEDLRTQLVETLTALRGELGADHYDAFVAGALLSVAKSIKPGGGA